MSFTVNQIRKSLVLSSWEKEAPLPQVSVWMAQIMMWMYEARASTALHPSGGGREDPSGAPSTSQLPGTASRSRRAQPAHRTAPHLPHRYHGVASRSPARSPTQVAEVEATRQGGRPGGQPQARGAPPQPRDTGTALSLRLTWLDGL